MIRAYRLYTGPDGNSHVVRGSVNPGGEVFTLRPGDVIAEDHTGSGHKWRFIDDDPWKRAYVVFKEGVDTQFVPDPAQDCLIAFDCLEGKRRLCRAVHRLSRMACSPGTNGSLPPQRWVHQLCVSTITRGIVTNDNTRVARTVVEDSEVRMWYSSANIVVITAEGIAARRMASRPSTP